MMHFLRNMFGATIALLLSAAWLLGQTGQIAIPRIDLMPNQPAPFNVRDWRQVALQYDSFVYNVQKTGQYLPLSFLGNGGVNYPQNPTFRLHTYVGTNSPFGNEAINVLPSLVGATLVGADKTNQYGQNWLLMSQDFFNKANGQNIYLNNAGGGSGSDWWYDVMPNVFFYQLHDLYPTPGLGEAGVQFTTIADRFLESVQVLGGKETPWTPANMNYRAYNFITKEPNPNGVKEPEAAGAYAWILYHAWKKNGNPAYRKGAEWSIEFLNNWTSNPSYELQLPYGTYVAAKMNAELGTNYDVEKMVNWSFNRGALRGWGTIVGTWGGFDVSGLVGEANDAGNDYAFQLNGVQQAAALTPMVRYDKRFARAIGKWVLNLANATRLFYPGFLPNNQQDASAWSNTNDPQRVMGYEAMKQKYQNLSPFSTGDALGGGWAATNLALYGTSAIGYLGCMLQKTNVDKILQLDLLKTDFYNEAAYPTYLYYNPYPTVQTIQFDAGNTPVDVYEALSETFVLQNVSGLVNLTIPANQAIMVTLAPPSGTKTYRHNQLLINGVVVDYAQHAQPYNRAPRIKGLGAAQNPLPINTQTTVFATVDDADSGTLNYQWSSNLGTVSGTGAQVTFNAPTSTGDATLQLIVSDPEGNSDTAQLVLTIVEKINIAPQIQDIQTSSIYTTPSSVVQLQCLASDANNDPLVYSWTAVGGNISGTGSTINWTAPASEGIFQVNVKVTDDQGLFAERSIKLLVKNFTTTPATLIAHYPFTGNSNDVSGNQLNGQANGALLVPDQNGVPQSAYYFNGGAQHIAVVNQPVLNFQDAITVSCWFKANALPEKESFLLSHGSWQNRWKISITPDQHLRWTVNTLNTGADLDTDIALKTDSFYQVAVTYDGTLMAIYLNGQLRTFKALTGKIRTTTVAFLMGQILPGTTDYNFKGVLDAVKIFDAALPPNAVLALYQQGVTALHQPQQADLGALQLQPNPVTESQPNLQIHFPEQLAPDARVQVCDVRGRTVAEQQRDGKSWVEINLKDCPSGTYTVFCYAGSTCLTARFIKI